MSVQPIVENAIKHGLENKKEGGKLIIKAVEEDNSIAIDIIDNGVGMSPKKLEEINNPLHERNGHITGLGITNVDLRLKRYFGKEALRMGAEDYLLKPVRPEEICTVLQKIIALFDEEKKKHAREQELREAMKDAGRLLRSAILATMLLEDYSEDNVIKAQAELLEIDSLPDSILVVEPDIDPSFPGAELERYEIFRQVEHICASLNIEFILLLSEEMVIGITSSKAEPRYTAEQIRKSIEEKMQATVTIGVGEDAGNLKKVYREACTATRLGKFYLGGNRIITSDMLDDLMDSEESVGFEEEE